MSPYPCNPPDVEEPAPLDLAEEVQAAEEEFWARILEHTIPYTGGDEWAG